MGLARSTSSSRILSILSGKMVRSTLAVIAVIGSMSVVVQACYEQCGGINYTGSTTCTGGCVCTYSNDWYSQCLPGTSTASTSKITTTSTTKTTTSSATTPTGTSSKYIFSFGDSYTQTGFDIAGTKPSASNPLGNPTYPGYTACGSVTNWIDVVTVKYNTSPVLTYNFAYGGATIDADLVVPYTSTVKSLEDQVTSYLATVGTKPSYAPWTSSNSLFSIFIGINDIGNSYYLSGDRSAFSDTLLNRYFQLVEQLYTSGGRNFLFINVPGVDRSPLMLAQAQSARDAEKAVITTFNTKLAAKIAAFKSSHTGVATWTYDANSKLVAILNSPSSYGLQDATSYGSAANLAWCNDYHISSAVHEIYGKDVATLLKPGFF